MIKWQMVNTNISNMRVYIFTQLYQYYLLVVEYDTRSILSVI